MAELETEEEKGLVSADNIEDYIDDEWGGRGLDSYKKYSAPIVNTSDIVDEIEER